MVTRCDADLWRNFSFFPHYSYDPLVSYLLRWIFSTVSCKEICKCVCVAGHDPQIRESPTEPKWSSKGTYLYLIDWRTNFNLIFITKNKFNYSQLPWGLWLSHTLFSQSVWCFALCFGYYFQAQWFLTAIKLWTFSWYMVCSNHAGELFFITDRHNGYWNL